MYSIFFNRNEKIIGFNSNNSEYYINLFYIDNVYKKINNNDFIQAKDEFGRLLFYKTINNQQIMTYDNNDNKLLIPISKEELTYLKINSENFSLKDILLEKYNQLISKFDCKECILDELYNSNIFKFNGMISNNIIRILNNNIVTGEITLPDGYKQLSIYTESNNTINVYINFGSGYVLINNNDFIDIKSNNILIKLSADVETDINSIAILLK